MHIFLRHVIVGIVDVLDENNLHIRHNILISAKVRQFLCLRTAADIGTASLLTYQQSSLHSILYVIRKITTYIKGHTKKNKTIVQKRLCKNRKSAGRKTTFGNDLMN